MDMPIGKLQLDDILDNIVDYLDNTFSFITRPISNFIEKIIDDMFVEFLMQIPPWIIIFLIAFGAAYVTKKKGMAVFSFIGLMLIWNLQLWEPMIVTIALVLFSTIIAILIGIPVGIFSALFDGVNRVVTPILDLMQTMPAFVYLIPGIPFFGLGTVSAIFATVIFAMPPAIRLTSLGIRQVAPELIEAGDAFGSTRFQKLFKLQLPLATPTIMAGVNQTIMLALSMAVIAAMIGSGGLGGEVWRAIQRNKFGMAFEAGICVVIVAIIIDRVTQKIGTREKLNN